jgi:hypothetical protein
VISRRRLKGAVRKLDLEAGDVVVITLEEQVSGEQLHYLQDAWSSLGLENKLVVLAGGASIDVLKRSRMYRARELS